MSRFQTKSRVPTLMGDFSAMRSRIELVFFLLERQRVDLSILTRIRGPTHPMLRRSGDIRVSSPPLLYYPPPLFSTTLPRRADFWGVLKAFCIIPPLFSTTSRTRGGIIQGYTLIGNPGSSNILRKWVPDLPTFFFGFSENQN